MSDLSHEEATLEFIKKVFSVMKETPQHTYQLLTKRPERVLAFNKELDWQDNIWMGTSVERNDVKHRIDLLRKCNARVKFLSIEPLIGRIKNINLTGIDWVIVGGESGPGARPMKKEWVNEIKKACKEANVPFFFKQWGKPEFNVNESDPTKSKDHPHYAKGGCQLDGQIFREMPV
jgi:protein gp37